MTYCHMVSNVLTRLALLTICTLLIVSFVLYMSTSIFTYVYSLVGSFLIFFFLFFAFFFFFFFSLFFFFNDTATTEIYTLSLHDAFRSC